MSTPYEALNKTLENAGVSKTIYALVMPETEAAVDKILDGDKKEALIISSLNEAFAKAKQSGSDISPEMLAKSISESYDSQREAFRDMYREAWTQKQDAMHETFFQRWKAWTSPIIQADWSGFDYMYPTAGASEALREAINSYGVDRRATDKKPVIHCFEGEYEGFAAYAAAANIDVVYHNRKNWKSAIKNIGADEQFYISHPSAIDGNIWDEFDKFAEALNKVQPAAEIMLDVTYVGCVAKEFSFKADHPNVPAVFFSLSKPCGAYYHRIGGMLSRRPYDGLFGNKWFKNLMALNVGTEIMSNNSVYDLPRKYQPIQDKAIAETNKRLGLKLTPSDVFLLGTMPPSDKKASELERYLTRGSDGEALVRVCLTPTMAHMIDPKLNKTVKARPHERLNP